eukprot:3850989-Alexandrium_andersonii.AAC.1
MAASWKAHTSKRALPPTGPSNGACTQARRQEYAEAGCSCELRRRPSARTAVCTAIEYCRSLLPRR